MGRRGRKEKGKLLRSSSGRVCGPQQRGRILQIPRSEGAGYSGRSKSPHQHLCPFISPHSQSNSRRGWKLSAKRREDKELKNNKNENLFTLNSRLLRLGQAQMGVGKNGDLNPTRL